MPGPTPTACVQKWLADQVSFSVAAISGGPGQQTTEDRDTFVSKDELVLYRVKLGQNGDHDIFFASRTTATQPFSSGALKTSLSQDGTEDGKISLAGDDLTGVMASDRTGVGGGLDLWLATRPTGGTATFTSVTQTHLAAVNTSADEQDPHLSDDGLELYYASGNPQQIMLSTRASTSADFGTPIVVDSINDAVANDADPTLTEDGRVIVFTSNRDGGADMFYATRAERFQPFGAPIKLPAPANSASNDGDPHITGDGCRIYFSSDRNVDFDIRILDLL